MADNYCTNVSHIGEETSNNFVQTSRHFHNLLNVYLYCHNLKWGGSLALLWAARHGQRVPAQKSLE
jgi:hypothetical protein